MYGKPNLLGDFALANLSNTEQDLLVIDGGNELMDSQLNVYLDVALGTHTEIDIRYYVRFIEGGDWYELPYRNDGTGAVSSVPTKFTTSSKFVDSLPLPACVAFKATAVGNTVNTDGAVNGGLMGRDN